MAILPVVSFVSATISGIVVGVRLLRAYGRTRQIPELSIGMASLTGSVGALLLVAAVRAPDLSPELSTGLFSAGQFVLGAGAPMLAVGTWRIFRPASLVAPIACALLTVEVGAGWLLLMVGDPYQRLLGLPGVMLQLGRAAVYGWSAVECFAYHARLRRQGAIGLADPVIAHQFWLWGVAAACLALVFAVAAWANGSLGLRMVEWPAGLTLASALALVGAAGIWLAFFPPAAYRRWVAARADSGCAAGPGDDAVSG